MAWLLNVLITIGIFILVLFILVLVHEFGHFITAKLFKMRVERFSIGYPPRLFGKKVGDTDYCISATPLGGYVKISGMIDESMDTEFLEKEPQSWEFRSKPVWQRIIVITAGVIFNILLAVVIYSAIVLFYGEAKVPIENVGSIYVQPNSLASNIGFKTGDRVVGVNGHKVMYFSDLYSPEALTSSKLTYTVTRDGQTQTLTAPSDFLDSLNKKPFISLLNAMPPVVGKVISGSPAEKSGIQSHDRITSVNGAKTTYWLQMVNQIQSSKGPINMVVKRAGMNTDTTITVTPDPKTHQIGIAIEDPDNYFNVTYIKPGLVGSIVDGATQTWNTTVSIIQGFEKLLSGAISVRENLGGPIAIATITRQATEGAGWYGFWNIAAMLSITLAIMNILPIPVLDGGHLMFLIYEGVTRREPSAKVRMVLQQIGFIFIIALIIFVTFNDILRTIGI